MFWLPLLIGAAGGALADKEDPMRGALIGAGLGATGGAAAGALGAGAGAGAAGATGAGTTSGLLAAEGAGLGTAGTGGLIGGTGLEGSLIGSGALASGGEAAALGAPSLGGSLVTSGALAPSSGALPFATGAAGGVAADQAAAPVIDRGTQAGLLDKLNFKSGGTLGNAGEYGKTGMQAYDTYQQAQPPEQAPTPQPLQSRPLDLTPILNDYSAMQQYTADENERRKQLMQMYANQIGGR